MFDYNDPFNIFHIQAPYLFRNTTPARIEGQLITGNVTYVYSSQQYQLIPPQGCGARVVERHVLTAQRARELETMLRRVQSRQGVPWIAGPAGLLPGIGTIISITAFSVDGLMRLNPRHQFSAAEFAVLLAPGELLSRHGRGKLTPGMAFCLPLPFFMQ